MNITVLYDNYTYRPDLSSGWGFSVLVDNRILFDTGEKGEPLLTNMNRLGISPFDLEAVVISHNHWDHIGGLGDILSAKPALEVWIGEEMGPDLEDAIRNNGGKVRYTTPGTKIREGIYSTGTIPATYKGQPMPEQALVLEEHNRTGIITGCSHPAVTEILKRASHITSLHSLNLLIGGFHWRDFTDDEAIKAARELESFEIETIVPTHCSGEAAFRALTDIHTSGNVLKAGSGFTITL